MNTPPIFTTEPAVPSVWRRFWFPEACVEAPPANATPAEISEVQLRNDHWLRTHMPTYLMRWAFLFAAAICLLGFASNYQEVPLIFSVIAGGLVGFTLTVLLKQAFVYRHAAAALRHHHHVG
ncbi:hypothetical protein J7E62_00540 [Variovorax paradoxus]|nr:hypothetical protein [Variovorax paradoxus]